MTVNDLLIQHPELAYAVEVLIASAKYHKDTAALAFWDARREMPCT